MPKLTHINSTYFNVDGAEISALFVSGKYAYIGTKGDAGDVIEEFQIFDISDPYNPTKVGGLDLSSTVYGTKSIFVRGDYAYVTIGSANLIGDSTEFVVLDISDPYNPVYVDGVELGVTNLYSVDVQKNYAYIGVYANSGTDSLRVIDISDPENLSLVGGYDGGTCGFRRVKVYNDKYLFAVGDASCVGYGAAQQGFIVFDISDPLIPTPVAGYSNGSNDFDFDISNRYLYLLSATTTPNSDLQILDISSTTNPTVVGSGIDTGHGTVEGRVRVYGDYVFVGKTDDPSLSVYN
ncbi:MAG TPA: hypothetical protein P5274_01280, partial [Candidatus Paceibacterota bacterium]|nr:hypothetical protein [Candidatus Paceibacterota bacterium]